MRAVKCNLQSPVHARSRGCSVTSRGFSLAELLVVIGIITLLVAVLVPPLQLARQHAMDTVCATQLQKVGVGLITAHNEFEVYPVWDDAGVPTRFTWIDVLVQRRFLPSNKMGYCPQDALPDRLNMARGAAIGVTYPTSPGIGGVDYSYGIGVPLSAAGWKWRAGHGRTGDDRQRRFDGYDRDQARRLLAADGNWSYIYNLNGRGVVSGIWNDEAWYDNTVAWRHRGLRGNLLMQDGHVGTHRYRAEQPEPVNTGQVFVWYSGEPLGVGPDSTFGGNYYPDTPPPSAQSQPRGDIFPREMLPYYYTSQRLWTLISHKTPGRASAGY